MTFLFSTSIEMNIANLSYLRLESLPSSLASSKMVSRLVGLKVPYSGPEMWLNYLAHLDI